MISAYNSPKACQITGITNIINNNYNDNDDDEKIRKFPTRAPAHSGVLSIFHHRQMVVFFYILPGVTRAVLFQHPGKKFA